jgi:hypothetical protein
MPPRQLAAVVEAGIRVPAFTVQELRMLGTTVGRMTSTKFASTFPQPRIQQNQDDNWYDDEHAVAEHDRAEDSSQVTPPRASLNTALSIVKRSG